MSRHRSLSCFLLATIATCAFAAPKAGIVSIVVPDAFKSAKSCADDAEWKPAKYNQKFDQKNCFKTHDGGSITLTLKGDNSTLTIGENSIVSVDTLIEDDGMGNFIIKPQIQKGYMGFNVEKNKGNNVDFATGTAAASIRGTEGFIGGNDWAFFGSLKHGSLAIQPNIASGHGEFMIGDGETAIGNKRDLVSLPLKSSGDMGFAKIMNKIIADSTLTLEELLNAALSADEDYQKSLASDTAAQAPADTAKKEKVEETAALKVPQVKYSSYDSLRCVANVSVANVQQGAEARLSAVMDGTPISEVAVKRDMPKRVALRSGVHEYEFVVENAAGRNSVKKTLGCYPMKPFSIKVYGKKYEEILIPPAPPGADSTIMETLQFQIRVPEYDPSFLNKVTIRQDGKVILQERLSQIQNLDYQIPVELKRSHKNRFDIEVIHKSGYAVKTNKVYEVKK